MKTLQITTTSLLLLTCLYYPFVPVLAASYQTATVLSEIDAGDGQNAKQAYLDEPKGLDISNNITYVTDSTNNVIEKISAQGTISTVAGSRAYGYKDGFAPQAEFAAPQDIAVYNNGAEIFVADTNNNAIRKISGQTVSTIVDNLSAPSGVAVYQNTVWIADTNNNRILSTNRSGNGLTTVVKNLNHPTKLAYWPEQHQLLFVNAGDQTVRAVNTSTGRQSPVLMSGFEDIGGIYRDNKTLFVAASRSIGVFNEIWRTDLSVKNGLVYSNATLRLSKVRETEHLNSAADVSMRTDTMAWEEYYNWLPNIIYNKEEQPELLPPAHNYQQTKTDGLTCLPIRQEGQNKWRKQWTLPLDTTKETQTAKFTLRYAYQGDLPFFRVRLVPSDDTTTTTKNRSTWKNGRTIQMIGSSPTNLAVSKRQPYTATLSWDTVTEAAYYNLAIINDAGDAVYNKNDLTKNKLTLPDKTLRSNQAYQFHVQACASDNTCGDWSDYKTFRTKPAPVKKIYNIDPARSTRIEQQPNGNFLATLSFTLPKPKRNNTENLSAVVQLCSNNTNHADTISAKRLYVLYKGGAAIIAWRNDGTVPVLQAGKHRFQEEFGDKISALTGRPKALALSSDQNKLYIAQNNQLAEYDFSAQTLRFIAGHLMDSYAEGVGDTARFSDPSAIAISPNNKKLYVADRNNHRIRVVDIATDTVSYLTGAGSVNYGFVSTAGNGYQEGKACPDTYTQNQAGCAYFNRPTGIAISPNGKKLYIAEGGNNRIRSVNTKTGKTKLIAGNGQAGFKNGVGSAAQFNGPYMVTISSNGKTLYVTDKNNNAIRAIDLATNNVSTFATKLGIPEYITQNNNTLYWSEAATNSIRSASLASGSAATISGGKKGYAEGTQGSAKWNNPKGLISTGSKLYVADYFNDLIREINLN
ncbi:MAG: hypothetical protein WCW27_00275 [Patescibacteria group bacterium]|jgi:DNA-binding beta-propeller fold protein YncE